MFRSRQSPFIGNICAVYKIETIYFDCILIQSNIAELHPRKRTAKLFRGWLMASCYQYWVFTEIRVGFKCACMAAMWILSWSLRLCGWCSPINSVGSRWKHLETSTRVCTLKKKGSKGDLYYSRGFFMEPTAPHVHKSVGNKGFHIEPFFHKEPLFSQIMPNDL